MLLWLRFLFFASLYGLAFLCVLMVDFSFTSDSFAVDKYIVGSSVRIYVKERCWFSDQALNLLDSMGVRYEKFVFGELSAREVIDMVNCCPKLKTFPKIIIDGVCIGGYSDLNSRVAGEIGD